MDANSKICFTENETKLLSDFLNQGYFINSAVYCCVTISYKLETASNFFTMNLDVVHIKMG